jgi:2-polyprenyl-3-methyl-5-hydroxy-6-metoxy-1,4-benzoquinol methylase
LSPTAAATGACRVCGAALAELWTSAVDVEYGSTPERFRYFLCGDCDALSIDPVPLGRLAEIYPETYYSFASGHNPLDPDRNLVTRMKARLDRRTLRRALAQSAADATIAILDVGGGTGDIAAGLVGEFPGRARATVVDIDADSVAVARERGFDGFAGRFEDFQTDERFDLILMLNLIEHVADPGALLDQARRLLAPGGVIWLQTPNFRSLDARLFRKRNWAGLHCPRHWVIFSDEGLRRVLSRSGLEPVELELTQGGAFWAASILGLFRRPSADAASLPTPLIRSPAFMPLAAAGAGFDLVTRRLRRTSQAVAFVKAAPGGDER